MASLQQKQKQQQKQQQPLQQKQQQKQVSLVISKDLNRRRLFRKHLRQATKAGYHDILKFSRSHWLLTGLYKELKCLLESELCHLKHCQDEQCQMQVQADAIANVSYDYFSSVLDVFKTSEATGTVVYKEPCDFLSVDPDSNDGKGTDHYLHADEIGHLVTLVNEAIVEVLTDEYADYPDPDEDANVLHAVYHTLRKYDFDSVIHLPIKGFKMYHTRADYWAGAHRFNMPEFHLEHTDSTKVSLSYRTSDLKWYCGKCLSHRIETYCKAGEQKRRRNGPLLRL